MSINLYKKKTINNQPVLEELLSKSTDTVDNKPLVYDSTTDNVKSVDNLNVNSVTASCFHGPLDGTAKNATCFDNKTYAEACADILSGCAADSNKLNGKTYSEVCSDILSGCAADSNKLNGKTYAEVCSDILSGTAANSTCFAGKTCTEWKDIIKTTCVDNAALATNATCFNGCTYAEACTDIRNGLATQACADAIQNCADFIQSCVSAIESKIPAQASASNQLADKDFVNSSIATNTANFRGTYACVAELPTTGNTNNDYAFICSLNTTTGNYIYDRYKWVASDSCWVCEYELNTTGFTAEQLASINSGITSNLVAKITDVYDNTVTICMNDECKGSFSLNQNTDICIDLGNTIRNANCAGYATSAAQASEATNAICFNGCTYSQAKTDILSGNAASATNATCFNGKTYSEAKADILSGCAADSAKLGNKDPSCYIDNSSTTQSKAGNLKIGAPAACTSTSEGGNGVLVGSYGALQIFQDAPTIDLRYHKYCGEYSARLGNTAKGRFHIGVNDGEGCTGCTQSAVYCFCSNGTFTGASTICASTNIYSNGCPVVTTGNIATVAPGYNCTGTSNYVVTTMVCCACHAKTIDRTACNDSHDWHIPLTWSNTTDTCTTYAVSCGCPLTFKPSTGILKSTTVCDCLGVLRASKRDVRALDLGLTAGETYNLQTVIDCLLHCYGPKPAIYSFVYVNAQIPYICEGGQYAYNYKFEKLDGDNPAASTWQNNQWRVTNCTGRSWTVTATSTATADQITWKVVEDVSSTSCINTSSCNAEYPLVFSTCCATPAAGNHTLYNDSANNLMYNPSTDTLTACCVKGASRVITGNPTVCTPTQTGIAGSVLGSGTMTLYALAPFIDFRVNNACADYSHRLIAGNGLLRVVSTNATGCTAATQNANFDFCSDGTFAANAVRVGASYKFSGAKADNSGRPTLHLLRDITCAVCCSNCGWSAIGKACITRCPNPASAYAGSRCIDFQVLMQYGTTGTSNAVVEILSQYSDGIKPVIVTRNDGCVYFATCSTGSGCMVYDMQGACCVICEVCYNGTAYTDTNGTYTIAKEGSLTEIKSCVSNATNSTCFGGCTYAQAKADILSGCAIGCNACVYCSNGIAIGYSACTCIDNGLSIGCEATTEVIKRSGTTEIFGCVLSDIHRGDYRDVAIHSSSNIMQCELYKAIADRIDLSKDLATQCICNIPDINCSLLVRGRYNNLGITSIQHQKYSGFCNLILTLSDNYMASISSVGSNLITAPIYLELTGLSV